MNVWQGMNRYWKFQFKSKLKTVVSPEMGLYKYSPSKLINTQVKKKIHK